MYTVNALGTVKAQTPRFVLDLLMSINYKPILFYSVLFCSVLFCSVLSCPVLSCPVMSCYVMSCHVCLVLSCPVMSCHAISCLILSCSNQDYKHDSTLKSRLEITQYMSQNNTTHKPKTADSDTIAKANDDGMFHVWSR